ncbi:MAG: homocysteine S-methyltransferase family protein, partial [SAR324 cluster bacterium]|nr:homocysteine S-methyltransferase family protein [SAR324 cluster bacterium]
QTYVEFAKEWLSLGTTILGGCCEIGPDHIAEICKLREKILISNTIQNHK